MEAIPLFDAQLREAAYQRNKEFERDLGHRQTHFVLETLLDWLERDGALTTGRTAEWIARIDPILTAHAIHLGMEPTPEAVDAVVHDARHGSPNLARSGLG